MIDEKKEILKNDWADAAKCLFFWSAIIGIVATLSQCTCGCIW